MVRAAIDAEGEVRSRLHAELTAAVTGNLIVAVIATLVLNRRYRQRQVLAA